MTMLVNRDLMGRNYGSPDLVDDYVTVPEGRIHFVKKGSGYPVVLLHPLGTATWVWEGVMEVLSQHYTCYAFDALGHGLSDKPGRENFSVPDYARAMDHAMQVLNLHRVHLVGNSFGAIQTVQIAASYPDRVDKMVVVGLPVWNVRDAPLLLKDIAKLAGFDENGIPVTRTLEEEQGGGAFAHATQEMVDKNNVSRDQAGIWMSKTMTALAWFDIATLLPRIKATASLVVYGEQDFLRELADDILRYNLPNCSKLILPGLGHIPQVEDPQGFATSVMEFLQNGHID